MKNIILYLILTTFNFLCCEEEEEHKMRQHTNIIQSYQHIKVIPFVFEAAGAIGEQARNFLKICIRAADRDRLAYLSLQYRQPCAAVINQMLSCALLQGNTIMANNIVGAISAHEDQQSPAYSMSAARRQAARTTR